MGRTRYDWQQAVVSAQRESDPKMLMARIGQATTAIERRYSEWGENPGTRAELKAIKKAISDLENLLREKLGSYAPIRLPKVSTGISDAAEVGGPNEFEGHARRLLLVLRSSPLYGKRT